MNQLLFSQLQAELDVCSLRCWWYPGKHLNPAELDRFITQIDALNAAKDPLCYGFFAPNQSRAARKAFLDNSIWCLIYVHNQPVGFIYNYDLGVIDGVRVIHIGLLKMTQSLGKRFIKIPYIPLGLGNLMNFGPYYFTNLTHIPVVVETFSKIPIDVYPRFDVQDSDLRRKYSKVLDRLTEHYIVPILGLDPSDVDRRNFVLRGSLTGSQLGGFETNWQKVMKSNEMLCNLFMEKTLTIKEADDGQAYVHDDLIQIGKITFDCVGNKEALVVLNKMQIQPGAKLASGNKIASLIAAKLRRNA